MTVDTDTATIALADFRAALTDLSEAVTPSAVRTAARLETVKRDITNKSPKTLTLAEVELGATEAVERELAAALVRCGEAARRASDTAHAAVRANQRALEALPDFYHGPRHGQSDTAREVSLLRAELALRELRADVRDRTVPELLDEYAAANREQDWLSAHALDGELRRRLKAPASRGLLGDNIEAVADARGRIERALADARARRGALATPEVRAAVESHAAQLAHLDAELERRALLVHEVKARQRYPLAGVGR